MFQALAIAVALFLGAELTPASAQTAAPVACSESTSLSFVDFLFQVRSLQELSDGAKVIVDASVLSVGPGIAHGSSVETDAIFTPGKVLKGPSALGQFAVSQIQARGMLGVQPGQRFILFLGDESPNRVALLPDRPGVARYGVYGDYSGMFCVDGDKIRLGSGSSLIGEYNGASADRTLADIQAYLSVPRLNGRVTVDGGEFPPPGLVPSFPAVFRDPRADFKIIFTPTGTSSPAGTGPRTTMALRIPPGFVEPAPASGATLVPINRDGSFTIPLQRGTYRASVEGIPFGYYIKSMTLDSTDLVTEPLRITGPVSSDLRITLIGKKPDGVAAGTRVSGRVTDVPAGVPTDRFWVILSSDTSPDFRSGATQPSNDGRFEFLNVPTGKYTLRSVPAFPTPMGFGWMGQSNAPVVVGEVDLNVDLPMFAGAQVSGRIADKDGNKISIGAAFIVFTSVVVGNGPGAPPASPLEVRFPADGTFKAWLLPGEYSVAVRVFSGGIFPGGNNAVRTVSSGSIDLLKTTLKVNGTTPVAPILITLQ